MLWQPLPIPILIFAVVSFIIFAVRSGKGRSSSSDCHRPAAKNLPRNDRRRVARILEEYSEYTAEVFHFIAGSPEDVDVSIRHAPGDEVYIRKSKKDGRTVTVIDGREIGVIFSLNGANYLLCDLITREIPIKAFILDRDMQASSPTFKDFLKIVVFYKMEGVPPSHLSL